MWEILLVEESSFSAERFYGQVTVESLREVMGREEAKAVIGLAEKEESQLAQMDLMFSVQD